MRPHSLSAALLTLSLTAACSSNPVVAEATLANPAKPHHRGSEGFQNNYTSFQPKGLAAVLAWKWQAMLDGIPRAPQTATPRVAPDLAFVKRNASAGAAMQPAVTWIGHATALVQLGGLNVITDPIFSERASPVGFVGPKRALPPGIALHELPRIDVVVVSHNHYDHLDLDSVVALARQAGGPPRFLVPLGQKAWFADLGITNATEMDWWEEERIGAVTFVMTPVQHWSGRGLTDRLKSLWGGWAMLANDFAAYHAGDTGYSKDFADIGARLAPRLGEGGFDLALIPIGAYEPRWFMSTQHVNPEESVRMHRDLRAKASLGIHWGTFELTDESLDEPPKALAAARKASGLADDRFFVLAVGETRKLPRRAVPVGPAAEAATASAPNVTQSTAKSP